MRNTSKAFISILGTVGHTNRVPYIDDGNISYRIEEKSETDKALYCFSEGLDFTLRCEHHFNMFPLVLENFPEYEHVPIYTKLSLKIQQALLRYEDIDFDIAKHGVFISEEINEKEAEYGYFLDQLNSIIGQYDRVIIDMTHGFRHFPILAIIDLVIHNLHTPDKIEYIFFAKELVKSENGKPGQYEIIDLIEYLELANLSYMLSSFNQNYTISNTMHFKNPLYANIAQLLNQFSEHFLSNSLKYLIEGELIDHIIDELKLLKKQKGVMHFGSYIDEIALHLGQIRELYVHGKWQRLYRLSMIMNERDYQLNAITLLFEAVGFYCVGAIEGYSQDLRAHIGQFRKMIEQGKKPLYEYSTYALSNQSRNIVKLMHRFRGDYLFNPEILTWSRSKIKRAKKNKTIPQSQCNMLKNKIIKHLKDIEEDEYIAFVEFIKELERLRNNLAHGNSSNMQTDVKDDYLKNLKRFEYFCIETDILNSKTKK
jgi:CRISPR-associated DxTHG motif protein